MDVPSLSPYPLRSDNQPGAYLIPFAKKPNDLIRACVLLFQEYQRLQAAPSNPNSQISIHHRPPTKPELLMPYVERVVRLVHDNFDLVNLSQAAAIPLGDSKMISPHHLASSPKLSWLNWGQLYRTPLPINDQFDGYIQAFQNGKVSLLVVCKLYPDKLLEKLKACNFDAQEIQKFQTEISSKSSDWKCESHTPEDSLKLYNCCNAMTQLFSESEQKKELCLELLRRGKWKAGNVENVESRRQVVDPISGSEEGLQNTSESDQDVVSDSPLLDSEPGGCSDASDDKD